LTLSCFMASMVVMSLDMALLVVSIVDWILRVLRPLSLAWIQASQAFRSFIVVIWVAIVMLFVIHVVIEDSLELWVGARVSFVGESQGGLKKD